MDTNTENFSTTKFVIKCIVGFFVALALVIIAARSILIVHEQENAVITQFGEVIDVKTAGFYIKGFWQGKKKIDMTTHGTGIGYIVSPEGQNITDTDNGIMITSDFNLLNIDFYLEYRCSDPIALCYNTENPEKIMSNIAMSNIRTVVSNYTVDEAMTTKKGQIQQDIKTAILEELNDQNIGLTVVNITIQDSAPPTDEIMSAFKKVEAAKQGAETAKNEALKYQNEEIPKADAAADQIVQTATATKESRIAEAEGQVARFEKTYTEYEKYPLITKKRMFYETMEDILPSMKVIITDGGTQTMLPLDSFSNASANGVTDTTATSSSSGETSEP